MTASSRLLMKVLENSYNALSGRSGSSYSSTKRRHLQKHSPYNSLAFESCWPLWHHSSPVPRRLCVLPNTGEAAPFAQTTLLSQNQEEDLAAWEFPNGLYTRGDDDTTFAAFAARMAFSRCRSTRKYYVRQDEVRSALIPKMIQGRQALSLFFCFFL